MQKKQWFPPEGSLELDPIDAEVAKYAFDNELHARSTIWKHVYHNEPIPDYFKPLLLKILLDDFKGKSKQNNSLYWISIIKEVIELLNESDLTQTVAIETVSNKYSIPYETLKRRFDDKDSRILRSSISPKQKKTIK
ncbi:hypothetical protein Q8W30_15415 [Neptunomonas phycophila]|uniref:HTH psq-type domain-containing protein n=1 Tax=Neptunomonas phycophila TaxID=1572645 RepID=A0ABT9EY72_9GAMM|nr:hypothetical protein [Neptunomonas phycophila]MDP2523960.1 hypothetical protein [Neptunomonas phycophila]